MRADAPSVPQYQPSQSRFCHSAQDHPLLGISIPLTACAASTTDAVLRAICGLMYLTLHVSRTASICATSLIVQRVPL